jgi:6-phosphogluconate dehydrogenase
VWQGGCIIRARLLKDLQKLYAPGRRPLNPLFDLSFVKSLQPALKRAWPALLQAKSFGLALPCLDASLNYILGLAAGRSPINLIQAQRDLFGAHTYRRIDQKGVFHSTW